MNAAELQIRHLCSFAQPPNKSRVPFRGAKSSKKKNSNGSDIAQIGFGDSELHTKERICDRYLLGLTALSADDP